MAPSAISHGGSRDRVEVIPALQLEWPLQKGLLGSLQHTNQLLGYSREVHNWLKGNFFLFSKLCPGNTGLGVNSHNLMMGAREVPRPLARTTWV